jgi:hypothetical protein
MRDECEHGQLARSCNICEYEQEIKALQQQVRRLTGMIDNGLGWEDMHNDIQPVAEVAAQEEGNGR